MKLISQIGKAVALLVLTLPALAETSVWKVSKDDNHVFIGGTIHILHQTDYPLPEEFEVAYKQSEHLVFEANMQDAQSPAAMQKLMGQMMLTDGSTLKSLLKPETYTLLESYLVGLGVPIQTVSTFKPIMVASMLPVLEMQRSGQVVAGVDMYYMGKSTQDGKTQGYLETIDQQIEMLLKLGEGLENEFITYTIEDLKNRPEMIDVMKTTWRNGDTKKMYESLVAPMREMPGVYETVLLDRNNTWLPKIETMLQDKKVEFILVGSAHLVGGDGVLKMLEAKGYTVEQL